MLLARVQASRAHWEVTARPGGSQKPQSSSSVLTALPITYDAPEPERSRDSDQGPGPEAKRGATCINTLREITRNMCDCGQYGLYPDDASAWKSIFDEWASEAKHERR